jgi:hypothetical protein
VLAEQAAGRPELLETVIPYVVPAATREYDDSGEHGEKDAQTPAASSHDTA